MTNDFWVRFVIENSIVVIALALIAEGITRWTKNERIANLVWLVVLAKFLVPSFLFCELPLLASEQPTRYSLVSLPSNRAVSNAEAAMPITTPQTQVLTVPKQLEPNTIGTESNKRTVSSKKSSQSFDLKQFTNAISWTSVVAALWLCGSLIWFGTLASRLNRFRLGLQASYPANESLQSRAKQIASKFRIAHAPEIRIVDEAISPILWNCGRNTQIFLPAHMIEDTSYDGMTAVLAHEMAHLRRLDHWVQRLSMLVLGLFWWHPVSWFAVKRLRQTQDVCCDLDVLEWDSDLQIAFVYALVGAATRVRMPAPTLTLAFLDPYSLQARVQRILYESNRAKLGFFKSWVVLLVGFCLASVSARIVAQTPTKQKSDQPPREAITENKQALLHRAEIQVLEPDGSVATNARYIFGDRQTDLQIDNVLDAVYRDRENKVDRTLLVDDGMLPLDFQPSDEFVAVWSEHGFYAQSISQLSEMKSIQLKEWVTLEVRLKTEKGPDEGGTISATNFWTSDGRYRAIRFRHDKATANQDGVAIINRVAPGGIYLMVNSENVRRGNLSWEQYERARTVEAKPGETLRISLGGEGRRIKGTVSFADSSGLDDFETLRGDVTCRKNDETVAIDISSDGSFECDYVPFGQCSISIRSHFNVKEAVNGSTSFDLQSNGNDALDIGNIILKREKREEAKTATSKTMDVPDEFTSSQRIAFVGTKQQYKLIYQLFDRQGQLIRSLDNIEVPQAWLSYSQFVAFDLPRNRLYLLSAHDNITRSQSLHTLDLSGRIISTRPISNRSSCRIAVNPISGDVWVLEIERVGRSKVVVLDRQGNPTNTYSLDAFNLCFSARDKAFWLVGSHDVNKVDPTSGESIASYKLPSGIFVLSTAVPHLDGGIFAIESGSPDMPKSANRVWRFDSNANLVASADIGNTFGRSLACLDGEIWLSGLTIFGPLLQNPKYEVANLRFNPELIPIQDRELGFSYISAEADGKSVWAIADQVLQKVTKDEDGRIQKTAVGAVPVEGALWASGN